MPVDIADVEQAEASLLAAKEAARSDRSEENIAAVEQAKVALVQLRQAWREEETVQGRRTGTVGGDAVPTEGA